VALTRLFFEMGQRVSGRGLGGGTQIRSRFFAPFALFRGCAFGLLWQIQAASVKNTQVVDFHDIFR